MAKRPTSQSPEWGTFFLIMACYAAWLAGLFWLADVSLWLAVLALGLVAALHSSLTHEVLHGHPFQAKWLNEALMVLPLTLFIPYNRFRDLHLAHHQDAALTDPYDDPESNYLDPKVWSKLPRGLQMLLAGNNTLLGRMLLGPAIGQVLFLRDEWLGARHWDKDILLAWALHLPGVAVVLWIVAQSAMPVWAYLISAYIGLGLLKIRTFLEHRAHEKSRARTVIIEDRGPLAFLFLNNNLHVVHHMNPSVPWYRLPQLYRDGKDKYLACNEAYVYRSYAQIFRQYLWRAKDPVPHPLWPKS
ncbi:MULTISPECIES: fatty acid desaturase [unclassified Ruegeria]|uniref:fatty acid desaturase n=1 Tax=unclassified Ruegeria TaxID=2625375 RepID=UPI0014882BC7|nr:MULTISPECIES: fatty acid desaturase [unclassified Ruegeria]NOE32646.1 fatty acid desaturase [Ruegeria sp. HKCCD7318]